MTKAPNPPRIRELDLTTHCDYVVFASSSGHCSLDCAYCIVDPIVKHQPTLTYDDFAFLFSQLGGSVFLILSGKGDFFAGYRKPERLLERLLQHDVHVALDINGVMIHELPELPESALAKIRHVNLTLHYAELVKKRALKAWQQNARTIIERLGGPALLLGFILTPSEMALWREALAFYRKAVFEPTGQPLVLIHDVRQPLTGAQAEASQALAQEYVFMVEAIHQEDFSERFSKYPYVLCPAGSRYFRVWNDGRIVGCPYIEALQECGNLKERRFTPKPGPFICHTAKYCDCNDIALVGKMKFPESTGTIPSPPATQPLTASHTSANALHHGHCQLP